MYKKKRAFLMTFSTPPSISPTTGNAYIIAEEKSIVVLAENIKQARLRACTCFVAFIRVERPMELITGIPLRRMPHNYIVTGPLIKTSVNLSITGLNSPKLRQKGKSSNLSAMYGMGVNRVAGRYKFKKYYTRVRFVANRKLTIT